MSIDSTVASLPALSFGAPAPIALDRFAEIAGPFAALAGAERALSAAAAPFAARWRDLDAQLRNAMARARGKERFARPAEGCSIFWRDRVNACFQEKDVLKRDELLDKTWWDAAGELEDPASPLGPGALAAYAVRLGIAIRRSKASAAAGAGAFDRMTASARPAAP